MNTNKRNEQYIPAEGGREMVTERLTEFESGKQEYILDLEKDILTYTPEEAIQMLVFVKVLKEGRTVNEPL